jgi:tetratricopeptide (TPR) repeat protein
VARELIDERHFAEGERALRDYLLQNDGSGEGHELLAYILLRENKPRDALAEYTRAAARETPSASMLLHVGQAYVLLGDNLDADKWTLRALQTDPKDADAWYALGRVRYTEERFSDALSCFKRVLELAPGSVKAETNLGLAYDGMNQPDAALTAYQQAVAWEETGAARDRSEWPLVNLATILVRRGQLSEAEPLLTEAEGIAPGSSEVHEQLGHLYLAKRDFAAAQREFSRACALDPGKSSLHFLLGQADKRLGHGQEADAEFALAAKLAHEGTPARTP